MQLWTSKDGFGSKCTLKGEIRIFDFFRSKTCFWTKTLKILISPLLHTYKYLKYDVLDIQKQFWVKFQFSVRI